LLQPGYGLVDGPANPGDESLFRTLQPSGYWPGTQYPAWAVRTGDGKPHAYGLFLA